MTDAPRTRGARSARRPGRFEAEVARQGETVSVAVRGALDFGNVAQARRRLLDVLDRRPRHVIVDVSRAFVDSSGIGLLIRIAQQVRLDHAAFRLVCDPKLAQVLARLELDELFEFRPERDIRERSPVRQSAAA